MASRIKMWSLERTIQSLEIHYQDGHWGLGLYSNALGNEADPYDEDFYYCFVPYPELEEAMVSIYRLFGERNEVAWLLEYVQERPLSGKRFSAEGHGIGKTDERLPKRGGLSSN